jgi:cyclohexanone monooxygenase
METTAEDEAAWVEHCNYLSRFDIIKTHESCNSWYLGANVPGKSRIFMPYLGGVGRYRRKCEEVANAGYEGFVFGVK